MRHPFLRTLAGSGVTTDPNFENVTLLLHGDGTNGAQNNTFVDGSTNNFTITRNGNTTQGTFSPYGDNWSNYFDGTGDLVRASVSSLSSSSFTIECWIFYSGATNVQRTIYDFAAAANGYGMFAYHSTAGNIVVGFFSSNATPNFGSISSSFSGKYNQWVHFAVSYDGSTYRMFFDGVSVGTPLSSATTVVALNSLTVGARSDTTATQVWVGYISNFRYVTGAALYTGTFTPATAPLAVAGSGTTRLLTCQSNRFIDNSSSPLTLTVGGNPSVQRFSPFSPTAAYAAGTIGGSGYFDGTNDYLTLPTGQTPLLMGSSDWTFEAWVYRIGNTNTACVFTGQSDLATASGSQFVFYVSSSATSDVYQGTNGRSVASPNPTIGQWAHVAWARTGGTYSSYLNGSRVGTVGTLGTTALNNGATTYAPSIGCFANGNNDLYGYIAGARLIKGSGGYDATSATITVPTSPPTAVTNTSLLLNFTNAAILDNAMMADLETVGNAQIDTTTKKYGTGSLKFDGTDDGLTSPYNPAYSFGTGDFTIEAWVYIAGNSAVDAGGVRAAAIVGSFPTSGTLTNVWVLGISGNSTTTGTGFFFQSFVSGTTYDVSVTTTIAQTTWHHLAVARSGTTTKLFLNGSEVASGTLGNQNVNGAYPIYVGRNIYTGYPNVLNGYIDDLRITKGVARYTANFTAPTAAFPDL